MRSSDQHFGSTFIAGFGELVAEALVRQLPAVVIEELLDGLVVYRTSAPVAAVQKLRFCNNSFLLFSWERGDSGQKVETLVQRLLAKANLKRAVSTLSAQQARSFRVFVSRENTTVSLDPAVMSKVEKAIAQHLKLRVNRALPDIEFWFLLRSENLALFGLRITATGQQRARKYARGELRQELAHLLCLLSEPAQEDRFLDPFCGSGAIVLERAHSFPYRHILAGDQDANHVAALRRQIKQKRNVQVEQWDALVLDGVERRSVNKVVTDPPWGFYQGEQIEYEIFYAKMLSALARVTQSAGLAVLLVGRKETFEQVLSTVSEEWRLLRKYDVLVSGKKAGVYKLLRTASEG